MKIRGIEVDFDFLDADDVERFEKEAKKVVEKCKNNQIEQMSHPDAIREECNIIEEFFNGVFGADISEKIFKGKKNLVEHIKAFEDIVNIKNEKQRELQDVFDRYQPNRAIKRNNNYRSKK